MTQNPLKVSVIIPTYNRKEYIQQAIDSALAQTYPDVEVIVMDDGSTDGTGQALRARYGKRIQYVYQENRGESAARNEAIKRSCGQYIAMLDSDDVWMPAKLERQLALLERRPEVGLVSCQVLVINARGETVRTEPLHPEQTSDTVSLASLVLDSPVHASTILVQRACLDEAGWFNERIRYGEDWDLCLRLAARHQVGFVSEPLVSLRSHADAQSRYIVPKQEAGHRFAGRLQIIEDVFPLFSGDDHRVAALKAQALAREYAKAALLNYVHRDYTRAARLLSQAMDLDSAFWQDGERVAELVYLHALALSKEYTEADAISFVKETFAHLPTNPNSRCACLRRKVLGRLHIEFGFLNHQRGIAELVWKHVFAGLYYDPTWLRNLGVLSILRQSVVSLAWRKKSK